MWKFSPRRNWNRDRSALPTASSLLRSHFYRIMRRVWFNGMYTNCHWLFLTLPFGNDSKEIECVRGIFTSFRHKLCHLILSFISHTSHENQGDDKTSRPSKIDGNFIKSLSLLHIFRLEITPDEKSPRINQRPRAINVDWAASEATEEVAKWK